MSHIGFDFGTTNSIISFHDAETGSLNCFHTAAGGTDYIPTVISYEQRKGTAYTQFGNAAKLQGDGKPNVCGRFKLRLGTRFDELIPGKEKTAHEAARDYIQALFDAFRNSGNSIESMVMTIPEAWYREQTNYTARENIRTILIETGLSPEQFSFQSEPVAAAAYFCWQWKTKQNQNYDGNLIVIDYGGGTLDVTLCQVINGKKIRTLESYGSGEEGSGIENGHAGSAFLSHVIRIICEENTLSPDERNLALARNELETFLISQKNTISALMEDYEISPEDVENEPLFELSRLNYCTVTCRHLKKAFKLVNAPVLEKALVQIREAGEYLPEKTKIIFVGGFSNFCCVENQVRKFFNSRPDANDPRFPDLLSEENKALAIAKGAALLADHSISVDPAFPYEVGIIAGRINPDTPEQYEDVSIPLIEKNAKRENYIQPKFIEKTFRIFSGNSLFVRMYRKIGKEVLVFRLSNTDDLNQLFPEVHSEQQISIGLSLDDDMIPLLHTKDQNGTLRSISLNKILERLDIIISE